ncbi:MAG: nucleoside recognition domain-containing protein [bacterium]
MLFALIVAVFSGNVSTAQKISESSMQAATDAVTISISLIGIMSFWMGIMKIAEQSGLVNSFSKLLKPLASRLFPDIPSDHPAVTSIAMNFSANALGLSNAATPLGIKAMKELQELNKTKDTATNAMCTFLAINTAGFQLIPVTIMAVLASTGNKNPSEIIAPTLMSTAIALTIAIFTVKTLEKLPFFKLKDYPSIKADSNLVLKELVENE